ncbi:putative outer membrane protein [Pedobacter psychrotolerans]|uniref:Putative outer membrane protein n=1 Tax=Pedobacter psychrotolerans TaxID=1843235 RepID=A0A4R2H1Y2_9SPHI|nr:DUF4142 domain-containing protein [Pedobacter psychrotolerans]TCO18709.1 putative outer membrane protein [Pedobacter psychrotolerans]GGE70185.1 hypothetical protein GCM10011413_41060 [Pedobacter psychrotolerans]
MKNIFSALAKTAVVLLSLSSFNQLASAHNHQPLVVYSELIDMPVEAFVRQAMLSGMKEVQLSGVAIEQSSDPKIKAFARMMINDHSKVNEELKLLAKAKGVSLPMSKLPGGMRPDGRIDSELENLKDTTRNQNVAEAAGNMKSSVTPYRDGDTEADILKSVEDLKKMKGVSLDQAYVDVMISDHQKAIALFEEGAKSKDSAIRKFASKHLPHLKAHLKQVSALNKS